MISLIKFCELKETAKPTIPAPAKIGRIGICNFSKNHRVPIIIQINVIAPLRTLQKVVTREIRRAEISVVFNSVSKKFFQ
jgi:hypothetical protein